MDCEPDPSPLAQIIRTRRTINDFEPAPPPREILLQAIELARWAPNHKLTQPWRFHLLGPETTAAALDLSVQLVERSKGPDAAAVKRAKWETVPGWLLVTCIASPDPLRDRENYAAVCCAIQNLMLSLWSHGVGSKWSTGDVTRAPELLDLLHIDPRQETVVGLIWYGYPRQTAPAQRLDPSEITVQHP